MEQAIQKNWQWVEAQACQFLSQQGLHLIKKNYASRWGEIDLIMKDNSSLVFIEVRQRKNIKYGSSEESITIHKQKKIIKTAYDYLQQDLIYNMDSDIRFDVICSNQKVEKQTEKLKFNWIKNAF